MKRRRKYIIELMAAMLLAAMLLAGAAGNVFADFTIKAGETYLLSAGETLTVDGNLTIEAPGTLDASVANTNFYNFTCTIASKNLTFQAGSTQTIANTLTLNDQAVGTRIVLNSSGGAT